MSTATYETKSIVSDDVLMAIYTARLEVIASAYHNNNADFEWLEFDNPEAYQAINGAEDRLNAVWLQCRDGKAGKQDFERVLSAWYGACMNGIKLSVRKLS